MASERQEILNLCNKLEGAELYPKLKEYFITNKKPDKELLDATWDKVTTISGSLVSDLLFQYAHISNAAAREVLSNLLSKTFKDIPIVSDNMAWFHWWGGVLRQAFCYNGQVYDFLQLSIKDLVDYALKLVEEIIKLDPFSGEKTTGETSSPWLQIIAGYDHLTEDEVKAAGNVMIEILLEQSLDNNLPLEFFIKYTSNDCSKIIELLSRAMNVTKKDDVKFHLQRGAHLANVRGFPFIQGVFMHLILQKKPVAGKIKLIKDKNWSDYKIWLLAESIFHDISFSLTGIRFDELDVPDWFAAQPDALAILKAVYQEGSSEEGQQNLKRALTRLGVLNITEKGLQEIKSLPTEMTAALTLIEDMGLTVADITTGKPAREKAILEVIETADRKLTADLRALYAVYNGIGEREIQPLAKLKSLQSKMQKEIMSQIEEDEGDSLDDDAIDIRKLNSRKFFALGKLSNGDFLFQSPELKTAEGSIPVMRLLHDESCTCKAEAPSLGFYAARLFAQQWVIKKGMEKMHQKIFYPEIKCKKG